MKLQEYLAKPNKTIAEHAQDLIRQAEILWDFHYINDKYTLICYARPVFTMMTARQIKNFRKE